MKREMASVERHRVGSLSATFTARSFASRSWHDVNEARQLGDEP
jgi:hypothetical protein